jgi:hypothetical protein
MELIQNHLAINQFQAIASLLSIVMAGYSLKQKKYDFFIVLFIYGVKGLPSLLPIISATSTAEKFYCCLDMASNVMMLITITALAANTSGMTNSIEINESRLFQLQFKSNNLLFTIKNLIFYKITSFYLIFMGLTLVPAHNLLPLPGILVGTSLLSLLSYSLISTNKLFTDMYFILYFGELLLCGILMVVYATYYQNGVLFWISLLFFTYTYFIDRLSLNLTIKS